MTDARVHAIVRKNMPELVRIRRHIHQNPEFRHKEFKTADLVEKQLKSLGIQQRRVAPTAIMGIIKGGHPGKTVALRADMDALEITERTGLPYASKNGYMHACGHDGHTTMLLGTAQVLAEIRNDLRGTVKLFFQPAEEGGGRGGLVMCEAGVMKNPKVDAVFALHGSPAYQVGSIATRPGTIMVCSDGITLRVIGRGGHAAGAHLAIDPIVIAARIIDGLQSIVSREQSPLASAVVTIASIHAGSPNGRNVIPDAVDIVGTIRAVTFKQRDEVFAAVKRIATNTAKAHRARCEVTLQEGLPPTVNDPQMTAFAVDVGQKLWGKKNVHEVPLSMGGEDFSYFLQRAPGCFVWLGVREEKNKHTQCSLHHPTYDFNDHAIPYGVRTLTALACNFLNDSQF